MSYHAEHLKHPAIIKPPDLEGAALAWQVDLAAPIRRPQQSAALGCWIVYAPWAHPIWHTWTVDIVHLRDVPGQTRPPVLEHPEATHEFMILTLDPASSPDPDHPERGFMHLDPPDMVQQIAGLTDEQAQRVLLTSVEAIVGGHISPDASSRSRWQMRLAYTVERIKSGHDAES